MPAKKDVSQPRAVKKEGGLETGRWSAVTPSLFVPQPKCVAFGRPSRSPTLLLRSKNECILRLAFGGGGGGKRKWRLSPFVVAWNRKEGGEGQ